MLRLGEGRIHKEEALQSQARQQKPQWPPDRKIKVGNLLFDFKGNKILLGSLRGGLGSEPSRIHLCKGRTFAVNSEVTDPWMAGLDPSPPSYRGWVSPRH